MKKILSLSLFVLLSLQAFSKAAYPQRIPKDKPIEFTETWGYVMSDRMEEFNSSMPITDLCHFAVSIDCYGELDTIPDITKIPEDFKGRKHLVAICESRSLAHFVLDPKYGVNKKIIDDLVNAAKDYDGLQIDFEIIPKKDSQNFKTFLKILRKKLRKDQMFTICVPARLKEMENDIFDYKLMAPYVDRIFIMAYDEHWSTSSAGPVAGLDWVDKIIDHSLNTIPKEKIIIGIPFYGRTWQNKSLGKAWYNSGINRIMRENKINDISRKNEVAYFEFKTEVKVRGYFDDAYSLVQRLKRIKNKDLDKVGFWRLGQEDPLFWNYIKTPYESEPLIIADK